MSTTHSRRTTVVWATGIGTLLVVGLLVWLGSRSANGGEGTSAHKAVPQAAVSNAIPADVKPQQRRAHQAQDGSQVPADFPSLLASYSPKQQRTLKAFYGAYDDAMMQFSTPEQLAWLARRGFPMPEDVLAAQFLSDQQLINRSENGDTIATSLLAERWIQAADRTEDRPVSELVDIWRLEPRVLASGSPFAGYFHARVRKFVANIENADQPRVARMLSLHSRIVGYEWASLFGDIRASGSIQRSLIENYQQLAADHGGWDYGSFMAIKEFQGMLEMALHRNPDLFANRDDQWPKSGDE